jgi:predicted nucleotidyltransferase
MRKTASGRFVLRLRPSVHESLREVASQRGVSLNAICEEALEALVSGKREDPHVIAGIRELLGDSMIGVVLFGSVARGDSRNSSDTDLLIVLDRPRPLSRKLYSLWDDHFGENRHSPHFVHLPEKTEDAGSLWCEAAVDGIVLVDHEGEVSRFLGTLRREIASGRLKRLSAYGHPYWVKTQGGAEHVQ